MQITDLFERDIHRSINGVIKADQRDDANVWQELDEYVITRELDEHLRDVFDTYLKALDNPAEASGKVGIWVSGFFGSGKSHFIKVLSYLLANRVVTQQGVTRRAMEFFADKITDPMLAGDIDRAITDETDVLLFNIDSKASSDHSRDAILQVFLKVFNEMLGFSPDHPHIARMEQEMTEKDVFDAFKARFEQEAGSSWVEERDGYNFYSDALATAYSAAMGQRIDDADAWLERLERDFNSWLSVENFSRMIREYLDGCGPKCRIVFLVDEVGQFIGGSSSLMLNLQTITENLGTVCDGRAWIIVTSQEDIDKVVGQLRASSANDFSKIQGRFRTRLSLSSANVDEVIQKRLLKKQPEAGDVLRELFRAQADIIKNQLSFSRTGRTFKAYGDEDDFAAVYPFAPYQFNLVQSIFESVRKAGATGLHLARGERSLLDAFQSAAKAIGGEELGVLVPLYRFYPSIESFLEGVVKSTIEHAAENPALQPFDIKVLQTLFLIRYVEEIPGNVDNLITLFVDQIDADRRKLRDDIEASLQRLEGQTLVSRNGDDYFFLTNEERDISREIKAVDLTAADEAKELGALIFDEALHNIRKYRFPDNNNDFSLNLSCDGHPHGSRAEGDLSLRVISPLMEERDLWNEAKCLLESSQNEGQVILRLPDDIQLATELRQYLQTDKYILRRNDGSLPSTARRIIQDRADENRQRRVRLRSSLEQLLREAQVFVSGHQPALSATTANALVQEALQDLVRNSFSKLHLIEHLTPDPQAEIRALLADPTTITEDPFADDAINIAALKEVSTYIDLASKSSRQIVLHDLVSARFARRPYGWPEWETVYLVIRLMKAGEISLIGNNTTLSPDKVWEAIVTPARWKSVEIQPRRTVGSSELQQARKLARDLFGELPADDEDRLYAYLQQELTAWQQDFSKWQALASSAGYPGGDLATRGEGLCQSLLQAADSYTAIEEFRTRKNDLLDTADAHNDLKHFFDHQKPVWDRLVKSLNSFSANRLALEKDSDAKSALDRLAEIHCTAAPYGLLREVDDLIGRVQKVEKAALDKARSQVLGHIDNQISRVNSDLNAADADDGTRNTCLYPLQQLRQAAEAQTGIAQLYALSQQATETADDSLEKLVELSSAPKTPAKGVAEKPTAHRVQPIELIYAGGLHNGYITNEAEAERFIEALQKQIAAALAAGKRVDIR